MAIRAASACFSKRKPQILLVKRVLFVFWLGLALHSNAQTVIFSNPGWTYTNTDSVTLNSYNISIGNCSSISFAMNYSFSQPWLGSGNMESNDECGLAGDPCAGDPNNAGTGSCSNCWDFLYVQYQIDGATVYSELVGVPGNLNQTGTINFGPVCTQNAENATIIVQTQTWAANESVTFSGITVTCWDGGATLNANPNPACSNQPINLTAVLDNTPSVMSTTWTGPGTIANPSALNTTVTNAPVGTNTYTFTTLDDNNCAETNTVEVEVGPGPTVDNPGNITVCANSPVNVAFTGEPGATFNWVNNNTQIGLGASGNGDLNFTAANVTSNQTATITVTPSLGGCTGPSISFQVVVSPLPTLNQPNNVVVCSGNFVSVNLSGSAGSTISWSNDNPAIGLAAAGNGNINFNSAVTTSQEIATITVIATNAAGCESAPRTFTITVNPAAVVDNPGNLTECAGSQLEINFTGTANSYSWTNNNTQTGIPSSGNGNISVLTPSFSDGPRISLLTVTPNGACPGPAITFTVTVQPVATLAPVGDITVCSGQQVNVNFTAQPANLLPTWFNDNTAIGLGITGTGNIQFTAANVSTTQTGFILAEMLSAACPGNPIGFNITIQPGPTMNPVANLALCSGAPIEVNFSGAGANATYTWSNSNSNLGLPASGTGSISGTASSPGSTETGLITVVPSVAGCTGPAQTFSITVNATPVANLPANVTSCAGQAVAVNFSGANTSVFNWTNDNTTIGLPASGSGSIAFTAPSNVLGNQLANITLTPQSGNCTGTPVSFTIQINALPSLTIGSVQCAPNLLSYQVTLQTDTAVTLSSSAGVVNGTNGLFTIDQIPADTNIVLTLTSASGCILTQNVNAPNCNCPSVTAPGNPSNPVICENTSLPTLTVTSASGLSVNWYNAATGGSLLQAASNNYTPNGPLSAGSYTFFAEAIDPATGCVSATRTAVTLTINTTPTTTTPANLEVCAGAPVNISFSGTAGAAFSWTNSNPSIGLASSGNGAISYITAANLPNTEVATITLISQLGSCTSTPTFFTITLQALPTVNLGTTNCAPNLLSYSASIISNADSLASPFGTITTTPTGFLISSIPADSSLIVTAFSTAGCTSTLLVTAPNCNCPSVAPPSTSGTTIGCTGTFVPPLQVTVNTGLVVDWYAAPAGGSPLALATPVYTPMGPLAPGIYTYYAESRDTLTGCVSSGRTPVNLDIRPLPTMVTPSNRVVCADEPVFVNFTGTPGTSFTWTNSNPAIGLDPSGSGNLNFDTPSNLGTTQTGVLLVTPADANCTGTPVSFSITVHPIPTLTISTPQCSPDFLSYSVAITTNASNITSTAGTVVGIGGNFVVTQIPAGTNVVISAINPTTNCENQQVINAPVCGCPPVPAPSNPSNATACAGDPMPVLSVSLNSGLLANWYSAATGGSLLAANTTSFTPPAGLGQGSYTYFVESFDPVSNCFSTSRTAVTLTLTAGIQATITGNTSHCVGQNLVLTASGVGGTTYSWSTGATSASLTLTPLVSTTYSVTISNNGLCAGTATLPVNVFLPYNVTINAFSCDPAQVGTTIQNLQTTQGCDSVVTTITSLDPSGCTPQATLEGSTTSCAETADGFLSITVTTGFGPYNYTWSGNNLNGQGVISNNGETQVLEDLPAGNYSITITGANGASVVQTGTINSPAPIAVSLTEQAIRCAAEASGQLSAAISGGTAPYNLTWNNSSTNTTLSNLAAGTYSLTITDAIGCTSTASSTLVEPSPLSLGWLVAPIDCADTTITLTLAANGGTAPYVYEVDGVEVDPLSVALGAGQHNLSVIDQNGCSLDSITFLQIPAQVFISLPADTSLKFGQLLSLTATTNLTAWSQITWNPLYDASGANTLTQTWLPEKSERITVSITDTSGCTASASIQVNVLEVADVYIPNVFLPNLDGINDFWKIYIGVGILGIDELMVFDRWGSSVYQLEAPLMPGDWNAWQGWDGKIRGKNADPGVYVYYAKIKLTNGSTKLYKGDVTLVR